MIFKDKIVKLPAGKNFSFYAIDENSGYLYFNKDGMKKKRLKFETMFRCERVPFEANYDFVKQLDGYMCLCLKGNILIIKNES